MTATDVNLRSYFDQVGQTFVVPPVSQSQAQGMSDSVKISHCFDCTFDGADQSFFASGENDIDVCRSGRITLKNFLLWPNNQNSVTIKAGSFNWVAEDLTLMRHARGAQDIDLGNWSDYDRWAFVRQADGSLKLLRWLPRTRRGLLRRVKMADGSPLRVRCLYADRPAIEDTEVTWVGAIPRCPILNRPIVSAWFFASRRGIISTRTPTNDNATLRPQEVAALAA